MTSRLLCLLLFAAPALAQQVTLPLPRLLTLQPMGGQAGTSVEVKVTGEHLEDIESLRFSSPHLQAKPVPGKTDTFLVTIAAEAPAGVHDARVLCRLGVSSARAFSVGRLTEITRSKPNASIETALELPVGSICNATMTRRAVDYYRFKAVKDRRVVIDCAAVGLDSRLTPVLALADAEGRDLKVNRTGGPLDFTPPADGSYIIKVHDLTYQGGERHFYRLALQEAATDEPPPVQARTQTVSAMSWPPAGLPATAALSETEPNNQASDAQKITLPCDLAGRFFPAADVDTYEFTAKKGEVWWVEVASERLGLNTDPFVLVQRVEKTADGEKLTDVAELYDIAPPMKVSSNGYSYDGPPYNAGSPDVNGQFEIKEDGTYRLQVRDLFGGTRNEPGNVYRLIVRRAAPDFSLAAWAVHMTLRNGDRAALSKPAALRRGDARLFEVVVQRRDGFDGPIEIEAENLPAGVQATGLRIGKGKSVGHLVLTANADAPRGFSVAQLRGRARIGDTEVVRPCRVASMEWPVKDAKQEIPEPRLLADFPVSVTDSEEAPLSVALAEDKVYEAEAGATLKIPLRLTWRNAFTGATIKLKGQGDGFTTLKELEIPIQAESAELALDLAALKTPPGEHTLVLYGSAVSKYRYNPAALPLAEAEQKKAEERLAAAAAAAQQLAATDAAAAKTAAEKQKQAEAAMAAATSRMKALSSAAEPKDTVDILVSQPIRLHVRAATPATAAK